MATLTPTGASGTGTETLTFNLGANDSGSTKTYSFKLRQTGSSETADTLTITQATSGVDVTSVEVVPSAVTINRGTSYDYQLEANVYPSDASDKRVTWSSDDNSKVDVGNTGWIRGVALTSMSVGIKATSVADSTKYDYCYVTVVEAGAITLSDASKMSTDTSASMSISLTNIDTSTLSVSISSGSWATYSEYDSSQGVLKFTLSQNVSTSRSTTVSVTGTDLGGVTRSASATLSQNGPDDDYVPISGISVNGESAISDDGDTAHQYIVTYSPSDTTQKGVTWDVVDATTGESVVGTLVSISYPTSVSCYVNVLSGANGDNVLVKATSTVKSSISGQYAVTVTYVQTIQELQVDPTSVIVGWDSTSDNTPVVTWDNTATPYVPYNGYTGFITGATVNSSTGKIETEFDTNTSRSSSRSGSVTVEALPNDAEEPVSVTVNYTQNMMPDPSTFAHISVDNLSVVSGGTAYVTATVYLQNDSSTSHTFSAEYYWTLNGYTSREAYELGETAVEIASGTKYAPADYNNSVTAHDTVSIPFSYSAHITFGTSTYFILNITMTQYGSDETDATLSDSDPEILE